MQLLHYTDAVIIPCNADSFSVVKQSMAPSLPSSSLNLPSILPSHSLLSLLTLVVPQSKKKMLLNCVAHSLFTSSLTSIKFAFFWFRMTYSSLWSDFFPTTQ